MLRKLRQILQGEKGQSLTEWALIALFVVGLVYIFRESSLLPQLSSAYDSVGSYLSGTPTANQAINKYGRISNTELMQVDNAQRIALDDATLRNIAGAFLGKSKSEIQAMLTSSPRFDKYNPSGALNQGNLLFDYYIRSTGDGEDGTVRTEFDNGLVSKDNLLNWMQGNYTTFDSNQKALASDNRYFFSNDLIDPYGIMNPTDPEHQEGIYAVSVRCTFEFDTAGNVTAVQIWATRNKKDTRPGAGSNSWVRDETEGVNGKMNIRVTK